MNKSIIVQAIWLTLFLTLSGMTVYAQEEEIESKPFVREQLDELELEQIQSFWEEVVTEYGGFLPESERKDFSAFLQGDRSLSMKEWGMALLRFLFHELALNSKLIGSLILLTIFCTILQTLQSAFEYKSISKVAYAITYIVLMMIAINSFHITIRYAADVVETMNHFMMAILPLLIVLLTAVGNITSAAFFHPFIIFLIYISSSLIRYIVFPLLFFSTLLSIVSTLTDQYKVTKLATFLRAIAISVLGLFLTVFLGVVSVQGATMTVVDGITVRTAKFLTGNLVPIVGRMFTDTVDTVLNASLLIKNTVGVAGLILLVMIAIFPALKILVIALIFNLSAAILQPLGDGAIIECLSSIGKTVMYVFASLSVICLMFFLAITMIIVSGNVALMMR